MNKREFLSSLRLALRGMPKDEVEERLNFYSEMIDDRRDEGYSERAAVSQVGAVSVIATEIKSEYSQNNKKYTPQKPKRRLSAREILLLLLGSPIWISLLIAAIAVVFSLYVSLFAVVISLWAVFLSLTVCAPAGIILSIFFLANANTVNATLAFSATLVLSGLSILLFFGCKAATVGTLLLGKKMALSVKNCFVKEELV